MPELTATRLAGSAQAGEVLIVGPSLGTSAEALWSRCAAMLPFEVVGWDLPGHGRSRADRESYAIACEALASFDLRDRVGARKVPLLVVAGQQDPVVPPELARTGAPDEFAVLPGCGHLPPAEDPAAVAGLLTRFFRSDQ